MVACSVKSRGRPMGSHGSSPWSRCGTPIQSNSGSERYLSRQFTYTYTYIYIIYRGLIESDVQSSVEQKNLSIAAGCDRCDPKLLQWMECSFSILSWMWWLNKILMEKNRSCFPSLEVAFDPWILYQVFSQNFIIYCGQYMTIISFRLLLSLLKRCLTPGVEMCKGHTSPLGATIARETWRTLQQRGGLTWWWPKPILFVSRFF